MSGIFDQYVILSDLDGTLFDSDLNLQEKDVQAIRHFTANGGFFGVSTGRVMVSAKHLVERLPVNCPCVYGNGGIIMDPNTKEIKYSSFLPANARQALQSIIGHFSNLRAAVLMGDVYYNVTEFGDGQKPFALDVPETTAVRLDELEDGWYKILMNVMDHPMDEVAAFCAMLHCPGISFVPSTSFYYEMLPQQNSKAAGNRKLLELMGWQNKTLVAIGDYYNDLAMIEDADIGVAVAGAPQEVREKADLVVCDVHHGAMADLIDRLEAGQGLSK